MEIRGIRNNNPFNLERNDADKWQGLSKDQSTDARFCVFDDAVYGIRAGMRNLIAAQDKHGRNTVRMIIRAFAPPVENNTEAYIQAVCAHMEVSDRAPLDMHNYYDLRSMAEAIIEHENGASWDTWYTNAQMDKASILAGVEPPKKSLASSRQIIGSSIAAAATVAAPVVQQVQDQLMPLTDYSEYIKQAFLVVALLGIGLAVFAKIDERRKGIS